MGQKEYISFKGLEFNSLTNFSDGKKLMKIKTIQTVFFEIAFLVDSEGSAQSSSSIGLGFLNPTCHLRQANVRCLYDTPKMGQMN